MSVARADDVVVIVSPSRPVVTVEHRGVQGPPGPSGIGDVSTHIQSTAAATWTIVHGLGRYPVSVLVVIGTEQVEPDVEFPDANTVVLTFATPQSGRAEVI